MFKFSLGIYKLEMMSVSANYDRKVQTIRKKYKYKNKYTEKSHVYSAQIRLTSAPLISTCRIRSDKLFIEIRTCNLVYSKINTLNSFSTFKLMSTKFKI